MQVEAETAMNKADIMYFNKLEEGHSSIPVIPAAVTSSDGSEAQMSGWALKVTSNNKRFSEKQVFFLVEKFDEGEDSQRKLSADAVTKIMRESEEFEPDEYLTSTQITVFFFKRGKEKKERGLHCKCSQTRFGYDRGRIMNAKTHML